ncbi:MarR family transcriptional regulator [Streptomyces sp. KL116D]|uniref:MarR family transcriptional regulator n=1 Tax=Streptomyces sp. KL116D TaxID=3045152 RepID=UPI003557605E
MTSGWSSAACSAGCAPWRNWKAEDITSAQASVISRLSKQGPASASDLAAIEGVRPQSMAKTVIALEQAGIDRRSQDPDDGRRQLVALTELPRAPAGRPACARQAWLARALQEHGTEEQIRAATITAMELIDEVAQA